ncbi:mitochondrial 18kDa protein, partial [Chytriomyces sp. MP71]
RVRNVFLAQSRLLAYTSEVGEAFRPVASPAFVTGAYAVSWAYVLGDVGFEAYKMRAHGASDIDVARTGLERGIFQSLASMVFPAYTVHWIVHQASHAFKNMKPGMIKRFGPSGLGLSTIPILPIIFDKPVEHAVEFVFD